MSANNKGMENYLENKIVYSVYDHGWFYGFRMKTYDTKEEAISYWEELTHKSYNEYDEYVKKAYHGDGHWYYDIKEESLSEYIKKLVEQNVDDAIQNKIEEIREKGDKRIENTGVCKEFERITSILKGATYYLENAIGYSSNSLDWREKRKIFKESLKDFELNT